MASSSSSLLDYGFEPMSEPPREGESRGNPADLVLRVVTFVIAVRGMMTISHLSCSTDSDGNSSRASESEYFREMSPCLAVRTRIWRFRNVCACWNDRNRRLIRVGLWTQQTCRTILQKVRYSSAADQHSDGLTVTSQLSVTNDWLKITIRLEILTNKVFITQHRNLIACSGQNGPYLIFVED